MKLEAKFSVKLLVPLVLMFVGLFITSVIIILLVQAFGSAGKSLYVVSSILQNIVAFILPAIGGAFLIGKRPWHALRIDVGPSWQAVLAVLVVYFVSLPFLNYVVSWNAHITLPDSLHALENYMRTSEDQAQAITQMLLQGNSLPAMLGMVLVVGGLTGVGEEFFFRGSLLGICLDKPVNRHVAVVSIAVLFSAFHLQFYGFFPRLLLGLWLGYLLVWTRSLWVPIIAHALNNSMVVVVTYLGEQGIVDFAKFENLGVPSHGEFPVMAVASFAVTAFVMFLFVKSRPRFLGEKHLAGK